MNDVINDGKVEAETPTEPRLSRTTRHRQWLLSGLLVAALAAAGTFALLYTQERGNLAAKSDALHTARSFAVTVTSYDYQDLDASISAVVAGSTGDFKDQYRGATTSLRGLIQEAKAKAVGSVLNAAVVSGSKDRVVVILFADQSVTNLATKDKPRVDRNRMVMTLEKHGDAWLVSKLVLE